MAETENTRQSGPSLEDQPAPFASDFESGAPEESQYPETSQDARNMAMLCHLLGIFGFFAPLLIWLTERETHRFVDEHGRETMNYQISFMIYLGALCVTLIGAFLVPVLLIVHVVFSIIGAVRASRGEAWHYPIAISFLKQP